MTTPVVLDGNALTLEDVFAVAVRSAPVSLAPVARDRALESRRHVDAIVRRKAVAYGITTGFGKLSEIVIPVDRLAELQVNLIRSHASGVGDLLPEREVRAMMLLRANVIAKGYTGASPALAELLIAMLNAELHPPIPEQGSVGASGDLAPLAHLALSLIGEGELRHRERSAPAADMLREHRLDPVVLGPKEGIVLINGTQAHTATAALAIVDAHRLWKAAHVAGAMSLEALKGTPVAFDERIQAVRGQLGQAASAAVLRELLADSEIRESHRHGDSRVQDPYSLRCMPQVHGPALDAIDFAASIVSRELNAATDNPLVFDGGEMLSGGNFHGQAVAMALDVRWTCSPSPSRTSPRSPSGGSIGSCIRTSTRAFRHSSRRTRGSTRAS
jgi:histidine ammonia-lyase